MEDGKYDLLLYISIHIFHFVFCNDNKAKRITKTKTKNGNSFLSETNDCVLFIYKMSVFKLFLSKDSIEFGNEKYNQVFICGE